MELHYFKITVVILIKIFCLNLWAKWVTDYIIITKLILLDGDTQIFVYLKIVISDFFLIRSTYINGKQGQVVSLKVILTKRI